MAPGADPRACCLVSARGAPQGSPPSSQAPRRPRSRRSRLAGMGDLDLDLPDYIDEELLDADEDFDDDRAGKRRKLEPEEEQRQLQEAIRASREQHAREDV